MVIKEKQNYLAVSDALLASTMLSNEFDENLNSDTIKIIDFIGSAFNLSKKDIDECKKLFLDDLTIISTTADVDAYLSHRGDKEFPEIKGFLYLKCEAIQKLDNIYHDLANSPFNQFFFDYKYLRPYSPDIRFKELEETSLKGNVDINRTVAILQVLGIGCPKDLGAAIYRFKQCAFWGDVSSLYYLSYLFKEKGDEKNAKLYIDLSKLSSNLFEGRTVIPNEKKNSYEKSVTETYELIASIKQDIVLAYRITDIDYSFVEVILMDDVDYFTKMECVNNYRAQTWKEISNSSYNPSKKLGFNTKVGK